MYTLALFPQEIAKRLQEEEEESIRRRSRGSGSHSEGKALLYIVMKVV